MFPAVGGPSDTNLSMSVGYVSSPRPVDRSESLLKRVGNNVEMRTLPSAY
jgi:hypothetical protein